MNFRRLLISLIIVLASPVAADLVRAENAGPSPEQEYLFQKSRGNYFQALDILAQWTAELEDPVMLEINTLRMAELTESPELYGPMLEWCEKILAANAKLSSTPQLAARVHILRNFLLLKAGRASEARRILEDLGYLREFEIIGPFRNEGIAEFENAYPPEREPARDAEYRGKLYPVKWFRAAATLTGTIDISDRNLETRNSLYYLTRAVSVNRAGVFQLHLGKTGYTDIWIDGVRVFNSRKRHGFNPGQYCIEVNLTAGTHVLLVKLGDAHKGGIIFSLRMTDEAGAPVKDAPEKSPLKSPTVPEVRSVKTIDALAVLEAMKGADARANFLTGYLYYFSGLNSEEEREAAAYLGKAGDDSQWGAVSSYYRALCEEEVDKQDARVSIALQKDAAFVEALEMRARIKLGNNFVYDAFQVIDRIKAVNPSAASGMWLRANAFSVRGFETESIRESKRMFASRYPSAGRALLGELHYTQEDYKSALEQYLALYQVDRYSKSVILRIADCRARLGEHEAAQRILEAGVSAFPADVSIRYRLAEHVKHTRGLGSSLPYLAAALMVSPYDSRVLFELGTAYHARGKPELALHFLNEALSCDPNNFYIKQYIETLRPSAPEGSDLLYSGDIAGLEKLAAPYAEEPAVMLLDETMYRVLADGSYERRVRKIYKLQHESILNDFRQQYIVFDPAVDRVSDVRCTVINDGSSVDAAEGYTQSLSDPESRLYYELSARTMNLPSLRKGSVVDIRYRVKSESGPIYHGAFGERIATGGQYRVMRANMLVSFPAEKEIYCRLRGIDTAALREIRSDGRRVYFIRVENVAPNRMETSMPPAFDLQPAAYFLSHKNWGEVQQWYASLLRNRAAVSDEMKKIVRELVSPDDSPEERVRKIYVHVSAEIRYVGFELGIGGFQPRRADLAYATRMGDCKDMSLVLVALLREAGVPAHIALLRTREKGEADFSIPYAGQFNHAICYADVAGGIFLDATAKLCGYRELPASDRDVNTLVVDENGYRIINTGGRVYTENFDSAKTEIILSENGSARLVREIIKMGDFAPQARYDLTLDSQNKMQDVAGYWNGMFPGAKIGKIQVKSAVLDAPVSYFYEIQVPAFMQSSNGNAWLKAFFIPSEYYRDYALMKTRILPMVLPQKWETVTEIRFIIPRGYTVNVVPRSEKFSHTGFDAEFTYGKSGDGVVEARSAIRIKAYRVTADEYQKFREFALFIARKEGERIVLMKDGAEGGGK